MTLLRAGAAHAEALAAIHAEAFSAEAQWNAAAMAALLATPGIFGLIHAAGGMALGRVAADEMEVLTLAVAPSLRRRGVGSALLRALAAHGQCAGAAGAFLEVAEGNAAARHLYAGAGFTEVGRRPRYYPDGGNALVLRATLPLPG